MYDRLIIVILFRLIGTSGKPLQSSFEADGDSWFNIPLPTKSYFNGYDSPIDPVKWLDSQKIAKNGDFNLLSKILTQIPKAADIYCPDIHYRWVHQQADMFFTDLNHSKFDDLKLFPSTSRAPLVHFGKKGFQFPNFEGNSISFDAFDVTNIVNFKQTIPRKFIAIGCMDSNWGWLSTAYINRFLT